MVTVICDIRRLVVQGVTVGGPLNGESAVTERGGRPAENIQRYFFLSCAPSAFAGLPLMTVTCRSGGAEMAFGEFGK